jgi:hypothetical protein
VIQGPIRERFIVLVHRLLPLVIVPRVARHVHIIVIAERVILQHVAAAVRYRPTAAEWDSLMQSA